MRAAVALCAVAVAAAAVLDMRNRVSSAIELPSLPNNFRANITIVAHLVNRVRAAGGTDGHQGGCTASGQRPSPMSRRPPLQTEAHPPWRRVVELWYDYDRKVARSYVHDGFEQNKTFLRRWDTKDEYCFRHDHYAECRRAFLSASSRRAGARAPPALPLRQRAWPPSPHCRWRRALPAPALQASR